MTTPELAYVILFVRDLAASIAFYRDVLELPFKFEQHGYAEFRTAGIKLGLFSRAQLPELIGRTTDAASPSAEIVFLVPNVDEWVEKLRAREVSDLHGPEDRAWGHRTLHFADPDGFVVELAQEIPRAKSRA